MVAFPLSLTGIPPPFGFVGKVLLFGAVIETGYPWLAVIGIPNSMLAMTFYLRIVEQMYQARDKEEGRAHCWSCFVRPLVTALMGLFAGVFPG